MLEGESLLAGALIQMGSHGIDAIVSLESRVLGDRIHQVQPGIRPLSRRGRHGATQFDHRIVAHSLQQSVKRMDLGPPAGPERAVMRCSFGFGVPNWEASEGSRSRIRGLDIAGKLFLGADGVAGSLQGAPRECGAGVRWEL